MKLGLKGKLCIGGKVGGGTPISKVHYHIDTSNIVTEKFIYGKNVLVPITFTPTKSGYTFIGWRTDTAANATVLTSRVAGVYEDINLYAVFRKSIIVSFNKNNNNVSTSVPSAQTVYGYYNNATISNPSVKLPAAISGNTSNRFLNWASLPTGSANRYSPGQSVTVSSNTTFYARWSKRVSQKQSGEFRGFYQESHDINDGGNKNITFSPAFSETPTIKTGVWWTGHQMSDKYYSHGVKSVTPTNAVVYINMWDTGSVNYGFVLTWEATGYIWQND